jgi:hypothetical protein
MLLTTGGESQIKLKSAVFGWGVPGVFVSIDSDIPSQTKRSKKRIQKLQNVLLTNAEMNFPSPLHLILTSALKI